MCVCVFMKKGTYLNKIMLNRHECQIQISLIYVGFYSTADHHSGLLTVLGHPPQHGDHPARARAGGGDLAVRCTIRTCVIRTCVIGTCV